MANQPNQKMSIGIKDIDRLALLIAQIAQLIATLKKGSGLKSSTFKKVPDVQQDNTR